MATMTCLPKVNVAITLNLSEAEARALYALSGLKDDLLTARCSTLGTSYRHEHGSGLTSLLYSSRSILGGLLGRIDNLRRPLEPIVPAVYERPRPEFS